MCKDPLTSETLCGQLLPDSEADIVRSWKIPQFFTAHSRAYAAYSKKPTPKSPPSYYLNHSAEGAKAGYLAPDVTDSTEHLSQAAQVLKLFCDVPLLVLVALLLWLFVGILGEVAHWVVTWCISIWVFNEVAAWLERPEDEE